MEELMQNAVGVFLLTGVASAFYFLQNLVFLFFQDP